MRNMTFNLKYAKNNGYSPEITSYSGITLLGSYGSEEAGPNIGYLAYVPEEKNPHSGGIRKFSYNGIKTLESAR
jgi:hypothetical protein